MDVFRTISPARLNELMGTIRGDVAAWKVVEVTVDDAQPGDSSGVAEKLGAYFAGKSGAIFICGARKVLTLGRLGEGVDTAALARDIPRALPGYSCTVSAGALTREGLETIAIQIKDTAGSGLDLLRKRVGRPEKLFYVVDDDLFMRSLLVKALRPHGRVREFADGAEVAAEYAKDLPDVVFLDIHLPCGSGIDILDDIMHRDVTAGTVILSADRARDNVLMSRSLGARSFIAKPFTREKIEDAAQKCLRQAAYMAR